MKYTVGNLLDANVEALVNTVNTIGVMGKGIALQFKERFPVNYKIYAAACKKGEVKTGQMLVVKELIMQGERLIINFPTKTEWFKKSQYSFIEEGLIDLARVIEIYNIKSIAVPPLGCGNGGLKWAKVKPLMDKYLGNIQGVDIFIYEPNESVKEILQKEQRRKEVDLKPGRAMLLYALFKYEKFGEVASLFAANKLAYFLQKSGEQLKLKFIPYNYGPYDQAVEKVLYSMNGKYLSGMEQMTSRAFEAINLNYKRFDEVEKYIQNHLEPEQKYRLDNLFRIINGFESTLSLEILASIDFLLSENSKLTTDELLFKVQSWNARKKELINREHIEIAQKHLQEYQANLKFDLFPKN